MKPHIPLLITLASIGIGMELWLQRPSSSSADDRINQSKAVLLEKSDNHTKTAPSDKLETDSLSALLNQEIEHRKQLEKRLEELEQRVAELESNSLGTTTEASNTKTNSTHSTASYTQPGFNPEAMLAAGIAPDQVKHIQQIYDNVEMEKLYLRDQAVREGWIGKERYATARKELDNRLESLRKELNDKDYDAYLYATGQSNRVVVESTMNTSPAQDAGMQTGDTIIRYDNKPIYTWSDLRNASTQCLATSTVGVEIKRGDTTQHIYLPCGPLGVRITTQSQQP